MPTTDVLIRAAALALVLCSAATAATDDQAAPETSDKARPSGPPEGQAAPSSGRTGAPVTTFTPSEQIKADSSVPFPVDI